MCVGFILREGKRDTILELDSHKWPEKVQCQVCGCILRRSKKARRLKTRRHTQCKCVWADRFRNNPLQEPGERIIIRVCSSCGKS